MISLFLLNQISLYKATLGTLLTKLGMTYTGGKPLHMKALG